jgi:hypothetical protein
MKKSTALAVRKSPKMPVHPSRVENAVKLDFWPHSAQLYNDALQKEYDRNFNQRGLEPREQLNYLKEEILVRTKITAQEIFTIGQLLIEAKDLCHKAKINFQDWITKSFDFSYETAKNFMHVYVYCLGYQWIAMEIKPSILYRVASPGFEKELREYLFVEGKLEEMTHGKLTQIIKKFKGGGFEAIRENIEGIEHVRRVHSQVQYCVGVARNIYQTLGGLQDKLQTMGTGGNPRRNDRINSGQWDREDEANKILFRLNEAVEDSVRKVGDALEECDNELKALKKKGLINCGVVEPKEKR